jgi:hypothetical protein
MAQIFSLSPELLTCGQSQLGLEAFMRAANNLFASDLGRAARQVVRDLPRRQTRREALRRRAFTRLSREYARKAHQIDDWVLYTLIEMALQNHAADEPEVSAMESFYL